MAAQPVRQRLAQGSLGISGAWEQWELQGYALASVWPGKPGTTLISGHRDTHFRFLKDLKQGDIIRLQTPTRDLQYVVKDVAIVDARRFRLPGTIGRNPRLFLSTCYPFDAIQAGGALRYLVEAHAI